MKAQLSEIVEEILNDNSKEGMEAKRKLLQSNLDEEIKIDYKGNTYIIKGSYGITKPTK